MKGTDNTASDRSLNKGREGFYGWMGLGGSIFQWNPELEIGFAFVPTSMHIIDLFRENPVIGSMTAAIIRDGTRLALRREVQQMYVLANATAKDW